MRTARRGERPMLGRVVHDRRLDGPPRRRGLPPRRTRGAPSRSRSSTRPRRNEASSGRPSCGSRREPRRSSTASRTSAEIFQRARQEGVCAEAGLGTFAQSWLRRKPSNITAIPTSSPTYNRDRVQPQSQGPGQLVRSVSAQPLGEYEGCERETDHRGAERDRGALETPRAHTGTARINFSAAVSLIVLSSPGPGPRFLDEFEEDAMERPRVDERDEPALIAAPRLRVDELESRLPESTHLLANVLAREREMMKSLSPALDEPRDHAVGLEGLEELHANGPRPEECHADALRQHLFREVRLQPEAAISLQRLLETLHRNADVVGGSDHTSCLGLYVPNTVRRTSLISPRVALARTESRIAGIRFPSDRASSSRRWRCESTSPWRRFARNACTWRTRSGSRRGSAFCAETRSSPSIYAFTPTTVRSPRSSSTWTR